LQQSTRVRCRLWIKYYNNILYNILDLIIIIIVIILIQYHNIIVIRWLYALLPFRLVRVCIYYTHARGACVFGCMRVDVWVCVIFFSYGNQKTYSSVDGRFSVCSQSFRSLAIFDAMFLNPMDVPDMRLNRTPFSDSLGSLHTSISHWTSESVFGSPCTHSNRKRSRCS